MRRVIELQAIIKQSFGHKLCVGLGERFDSLKYFHCQKSFVSLSCKDGWWFAEISSTDRNIQDGNRLPADSVAIVSIAGVGR